jgi:hypothetical protein
MLSDEALDAMQPTDAREGFVALRLVAMTALQRFPLDPFVDARIKLATNAPKDSTVAQVSATGTKLVVHGLMSRVGVLELVVAALAVDEDDMRGATALLDSLTERHQRCLTTPTDRWPVGFAWTLPRLVRAAQQYVDLLNGRSFEPPKPWSPRG